MEAGQLMLIFIKSQSAMRNPDTPFQQGRKEDTRWTAGCSSGRGRDCVRRGTSPARTVSHPFGRGAHHRNHPYRLAFRRPRACQMRLAFSTEKGNVPLMLEGGANRIPVQVVYDSTKKLNTTRVGQIDVIGYGFKEVYLHLGRKRLGYCGETDASEYSTTNTFLGEYIQRESFRRVEMAH